MQINYGKKEVSCKLVYYGPGMSGKTTNLEIIHQKVPDQNKGEMTSVATEGDRTLFFDFLPLDLGSVRGMQTKFQLYTVPGQVYYASTRKLVLQGADGIIFVADSNPDKIEENIASLKDLEDNLATYGVTLSEMPIVIQYNKRDLPNALPIDELDTKINRVNAKTTEAIAATGNGVLQTLKLAATLILERLNTSIPGSGQAASPKKEDKPVKEKKEVYVARVGADKISRTYFTQHCQVQYRLNSKEEEPEDFKKFSDEEKKKYLDSLIDHFLLLKCAKSKNISATDREVETQLAAFTKKIGSEAKLERYLLDRKLSIDSIKNEATKNVITSKMIKEGIPDYAQKLAVSDEMVEKYYNKNSQLLGGKPLEQIKAGLTSRLKAIRKKELLAGFFRNLRKEEDIEIYPENM